jgi:hypothetical protein
VSNSLGSRFWKFVDQSQGPDGCWLWTGALRRGYGTFWLNRRNVSSHVLAYETLVGSIPDGWQIDHLCHDARTCKLSETCPHRACVNPAHLRAVTAQDNTLRSGNPAARFAGATHCVNGHEFTEENTYRRPKGGRTCKACAKINGLRYRPPAQRRPDMDTHCIRGHKWSEANTLMRPRGRACRTCGRETMRRRRAGVHGQHPDRGTVAAGRFHSPNVPSNRM